MSRTLFYSHRTHLHHPTPHPNFLLYPPGSSLIHALYNPILVFRQSVRCDQVPQPVSQPSLAMRSSQQHLSKGSHILCLSQHLGFLHASIHRTLCTTSTTLLYTQTSHILLQGEMPPGESCELYTPSFATNYRTQPGSHNQCTVLVYFQYKGARSLGKYLPHLPSIPQDSLSTSYKAFQFRTIYPYTTVLEQEARPVQQPRHSALFVFVASKQSLTSRTSLSPHLLFSPNMLYPQQTET